METKSNDSPNLSVNPKLFISYSWSSAQHEQWVLQLATHLRESSVDVILDKWDLREGNDANTFMEKMVTDPDIKKVILVCDRKYAKKTDQRKDGVGTEAQIISPEIYQKQDQNKFVAVLAEKDENGKPFLPTYYKSRIYIDLSDNEQYLKNFEQLLRWIFDKPLYQKPELGPAPFFLEETTQISLSTSAKFSRAIEAIRNSRSYAKGAIEDYLETFAVNLERFRIIKKEGEFDDLVIKNIHSFIPYRNEVVELFIAIAQYNNTKEAYTQIHRFFERLIPYFDRPEGVLSHQEWDYDNFKYIIHELFLYCIATFLKHENFDSVAYLLNNRYFVEKNADYGRNSMVGFPIFRPYLKSLEYRNSRMKVNRLSLHADLLKERCTMVGIKFEYVMLADFILYLRNCLDSLKSESYQGWYPYTLMWISHIEKPFEIFARSESLEYFDSMKIIIDIKSKSEMNIFFSAIKEGKIKLPHFDYTQLDVARLMGFESLATRP